jgi:hypothetical protein
MRGQRGVIGGGQAAGREQVGGNMDVASPVVGKGKDTRGFIPPTMNKAPFVLSHLELAPLL